MVLYDIFLENKGKKTTIENQLDNMEINPTYYLHNSALHLVLQRPSNNFQCMMFVTFLLLKYTHFLCM